MAAELLLPTARATDANSSPYSGARWKFYASGTTTPLNVYADADLTTSLGSVVTADSGGKFAPIYFDSTKLYRGVWENASGSEVIQDIDPINSTIFNSLTLPDGSSIIGFQQDGITTVPRDLQSKVRETKSLTDWGVSPSNTGTENRDIINAAISEVDADVDLILPPGEYEIDTSDGLTGAIQLNKRVSLILQGYLKMTYSAIQTNPPYIINITGDRASVSGGGGLIGDGTINDENTGDAETHPGLIRVAADGVRITNLTFIDPPKVGIMMHTCSFCDVSNNQFTGGPTVYGDTSHFHISVRFGGRHSIIANKFYPNDDGGMSVQCIFASAVNNCIIADNFAYRPYEKIVYWYGSGNLCSNNIVIGNDGFIPGTNVQGTITTVFRFHGSFNTVTDNYAVDTAGGATCIDGRGNKIVDNFFLDCGAAGIANIGSATNFDYTRIDGNTCTYKAMPGSIVGSGILLVAGNASKQISVSQNVVTGFSVSDPIANIAEWDAATAYGKNSVIKPTVGNGRFYQATTGGTSHATTEPTWPTTPGASITDGTVVWVAYAYEGGQAEINIQGGSGQEISDSTFADNNTSGGRVGISLRYVKDSVVSNARIVASEWGMSEGASGATCSNVKWLFPMATGAANVGVQNISSTSIVFSDEARAWTPNQGAGLTVTGTFSSTGYYIQHGKLTHVFGTLSATTSLYNDPAASGILCTNLPIAAAIPGTGSLTNTDSVSPSGCYVMPAPDAAGKPTGATPTTLYGGATGSRSTLIFTLSYLAA